MKKFIAIGLAFAILGSSCIIEAHAQASFTRTRTATSTANKDTLKNVDTIYHTYQAPAGAANVTIQLDLLKATGSGAFSGKAYLYGSASGKSYVVLDSVTLADVAVGTYFNKQWKYSTRDQLFYRVITYGVSGMTALPTVSGLFVSSYKQGP